MKKCILIWSVSQLKLLTHLNFKIFKNWMSEANLARGQYCAINPLIPSKTYFMFFTRITILEKQTLIKLLYFFYLIRKVRNVIQSTTILIHNSSTIVLCNKHWISKVPQKILSVKSLQAILMVIIWKIINPREILI